MGVGYCFSGVQVGMVGHCYTQLWVLVGVKVVFLVKFFPVGMMGHCYTQLWVLVGVKVVFLVKFFPVDKEV